MTQRVEAFTAMLLVLVRRIFSRSALNSSHRARIGGLTTANWPFTESFQIRPFRMQEFFEQRSLEQVLSALRASYQRRPGPALAEIIRNVEAEIASRVAMRKNHEAAEADKQPDTRRLSAA